MRHPITFLYVLIVIGVFWVAITQVIVPIVIDKRIPLFPMFRRRAAREADARIALEAFEDAKYDLEDAERELATFKQSYGIPRLERSYRHRVTEAQAKLDKAKERLAKYQTDPKEDAQDGPQAAN